MAFFDKIKKKLPFLSENTNGSPSGNGGFFAPFNSNQNGHGKKKKHFNNLILDKDPTHIWEIVSEIGDGAFGKVYKAKNKISGVLAAAKIVEKCTEEDLEDYMIEIDILSECNHKNIEKIYEAYFYDSKLWVKENFFLLFSFMIFVGLFFYAWLLTMDLYECIWQWEEKGHN